jgi:hypothetical protein
MTDDLHGLKAVQPVTTQFPDVLAQKVSAFNYSAPKEKGENH